MAAIYIPVIAESDYPAFRGFCDRNELPVDYTAFLELVDHRKRNFHARGYKVREVMVDATGFRRRRRSTKPAKYRDLIRYAVRLVYRKQKGK